MIKNYNSSWDFQENSCDEEAFDKIYGEWTKRSWEAWLRNNLIFPFLVERMEDEDDAYFTDIAKSEPFRLGQTMKAVGIEMEDDLHGIIIKVKQGRKVGYVPLCDVEVTAIENENYWPVREYVVWFANR